MTNDERKRQRELFEAWAARAMFDSPLLNPLATNTSGDCYLWPVAQNKWNAWQACCEANGVGEPSDTETLRQACRDLLAIVADAIMHGMPITPAVADARNRAVAALAKREERA